MTEINAERKKLVEENGRRMRDFASRFALWPPFCSALSSVIYGPQWRQKFAGNTFLKIAQSGHRLDHGYSVDVRSVIVDKMRAFLSFFRSVLILV